MTATRLALAGTGPVAAQVPPGLRAFVLPVGPPAGTVRPGDRVDVVATYGANGGRPYTDTVATALEVIDVVDGGAPAVAGSSAASSGPPIVVLSDPLTVEGLARGEPRPVDDRYRRARRVDAVGHRGAVRPAPPRRYPCRPPIRPRRLGRRAGRRPAGPRPTSVRPFLADARGRSWVGFRLPAFEGNVLVSIRP